MFAILDLLSVFIAAVVSPLTSCLVDKNGELRLFKRWLQTPDSNMFGVNGDAGFAYRNIDKLGSYKGRVWVCFLWQWRNMAQGFSQNALGFSTDGYREISRTAQLVVATNSEGQRAFQYKGQFDWNATKRFRWNFGWKLNMANRQPKSMIVVSIGPYVNK